MVSLSALEGLQGQTFHTPGRRVLGVNVRADLGEEDCSWGCLPGAALDGADTYDTSVLRTSLQIQGAASRVVQE